jgi:hypothetical protein
MLAGMYHSGEAGMGAVGESWVTLGLELGCLHLVLASSFSGQSTQTI